MKLSHFQLVVAVAERGSIRAASRHLGIAQSALTRSLADLERELGDPLFERRARGVILTPIGEAFVNNGRIILNQVRRTREQVAQMRGLGTGTVTVGLSIAIHLALLPHVLRPFYARYPDVRLNIVEGFYPTLASSLRDGSIDFYIGPESQGKISPELSREVLFQGRRTILCRRGNPMTAARSLRDLSDARWISNSITMTAEDEIGLIFKDFGLPVPKVSIRSQSALTLITCLSNTDFLAMVPKQWTEFEMTRKTLAEIKVKERLVAPSIALIKRADMPLTPAATHFLDLLRRTVERRVLRNAG
jgi:LysR family transcriptional regulator of abg operon